jgi:hypothetical protein
MKKEQLMSDPTDLIRYRSQAHLELCLELVAEAYINMEKANYDLVKKQLYDILDTFEKCELEKKAEAPIKNIVLFPNRS